jgi:ferric-dicitrate binding protein FerR (iron transport regulator)
MEDSREPSARLLAAYLSGEASAFEADGVQRWAASSPECAARLAMLRAAWEEAGRPRRNTGASWSANEMWASIAPQLDSDNPPRPHLAATPLTKLPSRRRSVAAWATAAACTVLLAGLWADQRAERHRVATAPPAREPTREYRTERGQRASVTLPDGSAFQLGPMSVLRVVSGYGAPERVVELEGDAYFNVTHDEQHPFSVRTARTTIRDVGTRFVVRARPAEPRVEVAVAAGRVAIEPVAVAHTKRTKHLPEDSGRLLVGAGQAALVDELGASRLLPRSLVAAKLAWTRGELVFDNARVPAVLDELSRWYGDTFVLADPSLDTVRLTTVLKGETLLEALVVLETSLDVEAHVDGDRVTLTRHADRRRSPPP